MAADRVIYITNITKERLNALKYDNETYDSVINKLLNTKLDAGSIKYKISNNKCSIDVFIDWDAEQANITYMKDDEKHLLFPEPNIYTDNTGDWMEFKQQILSNKQGILNVCAVLDPSEEYTYGLLHIQRY